MTEGKKVVLVVEDERALLEVIKAKLEKLGFDTLTARSVSQALNYLEDVEQIDAVWLDHYLLGGEDGLDFIAKVKAEGSKWREVPVFLVSNTASADKVQAYMRLGAEKYFVKAQHPLNEIIEEIRTAIRGR